MPNAPASAENKGGRSLQEGPWRAECCHNTIIYDFDTIPEYSTLIPILNAPPAPSPNASTNNYGLFLPAKNVGSGAGPKLGATLVELVLHFKCDALRCARMVRGIHRNVYSIRQVTYIAI